MKIRQTIAAISVALAFAAPGADTNLVDWVSVGSNSGLFAFDWVMQAYVYDFVRDVTKGTDVKFLDYWSCAEFQDGRLYATSLFLNKTGRRRFTERVVADVKVNRR